MSNTATSEAPPALALTPGEPAGIGLDLALALAQTPLAARLVCYADPALLASRARLLGVEVRLHELADARDARLTEPGALQVLPVQAAAPTEAGILDPRNARYVLACLDAAADACRAGVLQGLVTGPVQKSLINDAGIPFSGHTEYLAERLGAPLPVMVLVAGELRVGLVTTHVALRDVPALITTERVVATLEIVLEQLRAQFGLAHPRVAVCGLNPHAGEGGHLGHEERDSIEPAIARLRARGWQVDGPLPADTVFAAEQRRGYDAIVAMYHDQGLAALKALGFGESINVTFGLPIIRTSVDHGTALPLAGTGRAQVGSLRAATQLALMLARAARAAD